MIYCGKKILLGICGSIAAYKAAILTRLLVKKGAAVQIIMTEAAATFISPLTLSTLSKKPVLIQFANSQEQLWNNHVELGLWADLMILAPASANTLAKMANGLCDNLLTATYLSARCPVMIAPAMDLDMWQHPATQRNIKQLQQANNILIPVGKGELASGLVGEGRLAEPEDIVSFIHDFFSTQQQAQQTPRLKGKKVLINAGPTYEPIDPVRFIGNRSTGKMGIALAETAHQEGANVTLVLGPTNLRPQTPNIEVITVQTAAEMFDATTQQFKNADIAILSAAVSDYTPINPSDQKIKKKSNSLTLELQKTKDILYHLGTVKKDYQFLVGFALETNNEVANARQKLQKKHLDFIVLNSLKDKGAGFKHNTNKITILDKHNKIQEFELKSKLEVAKDIIEKIVSML